MKKNFTFMLQTKVEFGKGCISKCEQYINELQSEKVLIVTDKVIRHLREFDTLVRSISTAGANVIVYDNVNSDPTSNDAQTVGEFARNKNIDTVVAFGGGSSMDIAKAGAAMLTNAGNIEDVMKPNAPKNQSAPLICIPTTAGTGSEVTSFSVLTLVNEKRKNSILSNKIQPQIAICDPDVLKKLPKSIAASTGMDALTHAIEAYTSKAANHITDTIALGAIRLIGENLADFVNNRTEENSFNMMMGSLLAGIAFGASDIAAVHCMAEALGARYNIPHGVANSIFLPVVFNFNLTSCTKKSANIARVLGINADRVSEEELGCKVTLWLQNLSKKIEIPQLNSFSIVKKEDFPALAKVAMKNVSLPSNPKNITEDDFISLFNNAYS